MPKCLNVPEWRTSTNKEAAEWYSPNPLKGQRQLLIVRSKLRPVDVYCYLVARFGEPNGFQNFLRRDDSDNWIHWDFSIKADDVNVYIAGTSRDVHIIVDEALSDEQWKDLILSIKQDYQRVGREKSTILRRLEKFVVFQNKYVAIAELCAELHAEITDTPPYEQPTIKAAAYEEAPESFKQAMDRASSRANKLYGNCLKLRLLMPIMAEAFINMIILIFSKDSIRNDQETYQAFIRTKIPQRLELLHKNCFGFAHGIDTRTKSYANFMRVIDKRNFALHGNVDPVKEQIETVYFDGKRPLFNQPGTHVAKLFEHLESINKPDEVQREYEEVHMFLLEIVECLEPEMQRFFAHVIDDAYPGYEIRKRRVTRILPDHLVTGIIQGMKFDDELDVNW